jgi:glycosyltransferase involved in cell wall biosynthesis
MHIVHLTASTFFGGPERQILGLAAKLPWRSSCVSFSEGGRCQPFLDRARRQGFDASVLTYDTPHLWAAAGELTEYLGHSQADILCCNGYKANLVGRVAARRHGIPAVAITRGWTNESWRVRVYEALDRWHLRWMDQVVCVSEAQAAKAWRAGVAPQRLRVIHNAVDPERFARPDPGARAELLARFVRPPGRLIGAAGRLSPEKGFDVLVASAALLHQSHPDTGFILFGDGRCRPALEKEIAAAGLSDVFLLDGFCGDLDRFLPHFDLLVLPSYTEGLPNVVLEACAAGVPVVATAVGGTPEILHGGVGTLVPPGDSTALARALTQALNCSEKLHEVGAAGKRRVTEQFSFTAQAERYQSIFKEICTGPAADRGSAAARWVSAPSTCEAGI